jgi:hypothetical protein
MTFKLSLRGPTIGHALLLDQCWCSLSDLQGSNSTKNTGAAVFAVPVMVSASAQNLKASAIMTQILSLRLEVGSPMTHRDSSPQLALLCRLLSFPGSSLRVILLCFALLS